MKGHHHHHRCLAVLGVLGGFGAHDFSLRHTGAGVAKICLNLLGWLLTLVLIGCVVLLALFEWWIVDATAPSAPLTEPSGRSPRRSADGPLQRDHPVTLKGPTCGVPLSHPARPASPPPRRL